MTHIVSQSIKFSRAKNHARVPLKPRMITIMLTKLASTSMHNIVLFKQLSSAALNANSILKLWIV